MAIFKREFWAQLVTEFEKKPGLITSPSTGPYSKLFNSMKIRSSWEARVVFAADLVGGYKSRYETVMRMSNVPWHIIGLIHLMESNCNFKTHLHNGDSLSARTVHVPRGRPKKGEPPFSWEESAVDALEYDGIKSIDTLEKQLAALEKFNGMGYRKKGINTPYLWSGSNHYTKGKFVSDGVYSSEAVSQQVGAAPVLKVLIQRGLV